MAATASDEITINVKTLDAKVFQIRVPNDILVEELKRRIAASQSIPENAQRLIYQGKVLRDEKTVKFYSIKDEHTIHMVQKPPQTGAQPAAEEPQPQTPSAPRSGPFGGPSMLVGSITLPEEGAAPDISQLLGNVFNTLTGGAASGRSLASAMQIQIDPAQTAQLLDSVNAQIPEIQNLANSNASNSASTPSSTPNAVEAVGKNLADVNSGLVQLRPSLERLAALLQQESTMQDVSLRSHTEELSHQVAPVLQTLSVLLNSLSTNLSAVQMGEATGGAQMTRATGVTNQGQQSGAPAQVSVPVITISQRNPNQAVVTTPATTQPGPANMNPLFSAITSLMGNLGELNTGATAQSPAAASGQPAANPLQGILQMMGPMLQQNSQGAPVPTQPAQNAPRAAPVTPPSTAASQPTTAANQQANPDLSAMMAQMFQALGSQPQPTGGTPGANPFSQLLQMMGGQRTGQNIGRAPQTAPASNSGNAGNAARPNANVNANPARLSNSGALMSQTFSAVNQAMTGAQPQTMSSVIGSIAQGIHVEGDKDEGMIGDILQKVMDALTIPDMLKIMSGNWEPFDRIHPALKEFVEDSLKGDHSPARIDKLADELTETFRTSMSEKNLPEDIKKRIKPGHEITSIAAHTLRKHTAKLILLIITTPVHTQIASNPQNPGQPSRQGQHFAVAVQEWTTNFVTELVSLLSQVLHGGVPDTAVVIKFFLLERLSLMGLGPEFAAMGTNMVTSYIMSNYANSQAALQPDPQDPSTWNNTIAVDDIRQTASQPQTPLSDSYLTGGPAKKRKTAKAVVTTSPQNLMQERLNEAVKSAQVTPKEGADLSSKPPQNNLSQKYVQQLKEDVTKRAPDTKKS
eukprot:TRINITY_DN4774_c0_g1_i1.p1 TRINITY_DN4774_c0_g1~~TRINITY_DN4774_c0_g1_i1.p1  ORF type:complete len:860 (-),score=226.42 TRINITY_DN4774_c0_g1_i1:8-2587(-)